MKKTVKKLVAIAGAVAMLGCTGATIVACGNNEGSTQDNSYSYNTFTTVMPSNWNELTYEDANDTQIMSYISSSFFEFDFKWDESKGGKFKDGKVNADAIVEGGFSIQTSAATKIEDVTNKTFPGSEQTYAEHYGLTDGEETPTEEYCYKITLREDLKWDDGTAIDASDFLYSMKEQLDPAFQNYRANSYYDTTPIVGAKGYVYQGQKSWYAASTPYALSDYSAAMDDKLVYSVGSAADNAEKGKAISYVRDWANDYIGKDATAETFYKFLILNGFIDGAATDYLVLEGKTLKEIKETPELKALWDKLIGFWQTDPGEEMHFMITEYEWPEKTFDSVGFTTPGKYEIVICFSNPQTFFKEDGSYSYEIAYTMSGLPLVKKDLYESCKQAPAEGATLWTSTYNSSYETTASWGPYKLTSFQSGKSYTLEKNPYWYGYNLDQYKDQYLVDKINCEQIAETATQWMSFLSGKTDDVGIDVSHADDYRNSKYAQYTPGSGCFSLNLFGDLKTLKANDRNNAILAISDFRKAVSLAIDRDDYNAKTTTAHQSLYGNLNSMYYYDVENGLRYRDTDIAKKTLLRAYGYVEESDGTWSLASNSQISHLALEEAYKTLKGYDIAQARELVESAYEELTANAADYGYDDSQKIKFIYGTSTDKDTTRRDYEYIKGVFENLFKGTSLEGKVEIEFNASYGSDWNKEFKAGSYDIASGTGWSGAAFNPCYMISAYLDPKVAYSTWWDTESETMTFTMPGDDENNGLGVELTMTIMNWYRCLNGTASTNDRYTYNWSDGKIPTDSRLELLAQLEYTSLRQYYSIPTTTQISASLLGKKFSNLTYEYNTFMGFGGMQYIRVNYTNSEWDAYVTSNGNNLEAEYKKTE